MSRLILIFLFIGILYIALTYLKGSRNTNTDSRGFTTHPFSGGGRGYDGLPPELEVTEEELETGEVGEDQYFEVDEADEEYFEELEHDVVAADVGTATETGALSESNADPAAGEASDPDGTSAAYTPVEPGVIIDSEVHIDAEMSSDTGTAEIHQHTEKGQ